LHQPIETLTAMIILWFLLFLAWPVAEIAIFVKAAGAIGWAGAILATIGTAILGAYLMRVQGFAAMQRFLSSAERGEPPVGAVLDGMGIFAAGFLLVLPGFLSDLLGLLLFIPPLRRGLIARLLFPRQPQGQAGRARPGRDGFRPHQEAGTGNTGLRRSDNAVDAEFETLEPPATPNSAEAPPSNRRSPWRGP
jgi:UPF0716 protein FxsA